MLFAIKVSQKYIYTNAPELKNMQMRNANSTHFELLHDYDKVGMILRIFTCMDGTTYLVGLNHT